MANFKIGLEYYSADTDRFQDIRIKRLKKDFGCDGFAVYEYILNEIYRVKGCFLAWDESTAFDVAEYWGLKETKVNEIVCYCCAVGLFDKALFNKSNVLTNMEIQQQYIKRSMFIDLAFIPNEILLVDESRIPFYKKNKRGRLYERNLRLWKKITRIVFERDNFTCQYCKQKGGILEIDHVVPFSKGGSDDINNLVTSCRKCNRQKRDKSLDEFLKWKEHHGT